MTYLLDTDHFSVIQRQSQPFLSVLLSRMAASHEHDFAVSIVTFHEQLLGAHQHIQTARSDYELLQGYRYIQRAFVDYERFPVLAFEASAQAVF